MGNYSQMSGALSRITPVAMQIRIDCLLTGTIA
jgi:hypothetical protein